MSSLPSEAKKLEDWTDAEVATALEVVASMRGCINHIKNNAQSIKGALLDDNNFGGVIYSYTQSLLFDLSSNTSLYVDIIEDRFNQEISRRASEAEAKQNAEKKASIEEDFAQLLSDKYDMTWEEYKNL